MPLFYTKKLNSSTPRLGYILEQTRKDFDVDLKTVSGAINIPEKYLYAIEKNRFMDLPKAKVYRINYIKKYANFLNLDEKIVTEHFVKEKGLVNIKVVHPKKTRKTTPLFSLSIIARNIIVASFIFLFVGYLSWQVRRILEPPKLMVYNPTEGITISTHTINVKGETDNECHLDINGKEIRLDENGRFNLAVDLSDGLNTIIITATKKHGKISTITRHIVVKKTISFSTN